MIRGAVAVFLVSALVGCGASADEPTGPVTDDLGWAGSKVAFLDREGECYIHDSKSGTLLATSLPAPCRLIRSASRKDHYTYEEVGTVFIFVGAPAPDSAYEHYSDFGPDDQCSTYSRALILPPEGGISLSKNCYDDSHPGLSCPALVPDEKDYWGFAHHDNPQLTCE